MLALSVTAFDFAGEKSDPKPAEFDTFSVSSLAERQKASSQATQLAGDLWVRHEGLDIGQCACVCHNALGILLGHKLLTEDVFLIAALLD